MMKELGIFENESQGGRLLRFEAGLLSVTCYLEQESLG